MPFVSWKMFFLSTSAVGNGGALKRPSKDYEETNEKIRNGILIINNNDDNNNGDNNNSNGNNNDNN